MNMKKMDEKTKRNMWLIVFAMFLLLIVLNVQSVLGIAGFILKAASPVIVGLAMAFILNVPMTLFESKVFAFMDKSKKKFVRALKKPICLISALLVVALILTLVIALILPAIIDAIKELIKIISENASSLPGWLSKTVTKLHLPEDIINRYTLDREQFIDTMVEYIREKASSVVSTTATFTVSVISTVANLGLSFVVAIYMLTCKERVKSFLNRMLNSFTSENFADTTRKVFHVAYKSFSGFIEGQFTDSVILGMLCYIGMTVFGFEYAAVISAVVGVAQLIPVIGGIVSAIIGALFMLTVSPLKSLMFLIFLIAIQQLEGNIIYPRIVGKQVGMPGILVISAVIIGANTFGIVGVLVGIPLVSTIYALIKTAMDEREEKAEALKQNNE